jgi:predicted nucleotide-binding protein
LVKDLSTGLEVALLIAEEEAKASKHECIEREHMLEAIFGLKKAGLMLKQKKLMPEEKLDKLQIEQKDLDSLFASLNLDPDLLWKQLKKKFSISDYESCNGNKSPECEQVFIWAEVHSKGKEVTSLDFLLALMQNPGEIITEVLKEAETDPIVIWKSIIDKTTQNVTEKPIEKIPKPKDNAHTKRTKVFIVSCTGSAPALALHKHLAELKLDVELFEDAIGNENRTIIDVLDELTKKTAYAFIIATPDDVGIERKTLIEAKDGVIFNVPIDPRDVNRLISMQKTRARQNVIFEYGLFMGVLGNERTCCCILKNGIQEMPSDVGGMFFLEYREKISEVFHLIDRKLRDPKIGLLK